MSDNATRSRAAYDQGYSDGQVGEYQPEKYATPDRVADALIEVRARVYACTSVMPDGERVILQTTMLKIIENVLKEYGDA